MSDPTAVTVDDLVPLIEAATQAVSDAYEVERSRYRTVHLTRALLALSELRGLATATTAARTQ